MGKKTPRFIVEQTIVYEFDAADFAEAELIISRVNREIRADDKQGTIADITNRYIRRADPDPALESEED